MIHSTRWCTFPGFMSSHFDHTFLEIISLCYISLQIVLLHAHSPIFFFKLNSFPPNQSALTMFYRDSLKRLTVQESTNALVLLLRGRSSPCRLIINQTCWCHEEKSATLPSFKERVNEPSSLVLDALLAINSGRESSVQSRGSRMNVGSLSFSLHDGGFSKLDENPTLESSRLKPLDVLASTNDEARVK